MSRRSRAREAVLQVLYQDDLNPGRRLDPDESFLRERLQHDDILVEFAKELLRGVRLYRREVDAKLTQLATNWTLSRMAATDRNALRIGAYEILFAETPGRVAVNEAVELAKKFGSKQSAPFVNGVLDRLMHHPNMEPAEAPESPVPSDATPES
jgi:N utilization substance protein B